MGNVLGHVEGLKDKHRALDAEISSLEKCRHPNNELRINFLKRQKLRVKEQIVQATRQLNGAESA